MLNKTGIMPAAIALTALAALASPVLAGVLHEAHLTGQIEDENPFGGDTEHISFDTYNQIGYSRYWSESGAFVNTSANQAWLALDVHVPSSMIDLDLNFNYTVVFDEPTFVLVQYLVTGMSSHVSVFNQTYLVEANDPWTISGYANSYAGIPGDMEIDLTFSPVTGACCLLDSCDLMGQADCDAAGGMWLPGQLECQENTCDAAYGACCTNGDCVVEFLDAGDCIVYGGTWLGVGSTCSQCQGTGEECAADLDNDGDVDVLDLLAIIEAWGNCP